jgi:hypothetical protein
MLFSPVSVTHRETPDEADNERSPAHALFKLLRSTKSAADAWRCSRVHDSEQCAGILAHDITSEQAPSSPEQRGSLELLGQSGVSENMGDQNRDKSASRLVRCRPRSKAGVMDTHGVSAGNRLIDKIREVTPVTATINTTLEKRELAASST